MAIYALWNHQKISKRRVFYCSALARLKYILNRNDKSEHTTHLDNVVRIIIVCRVLTEKMRSGKFQASVASYIESYNTQRPHRTLKNLTPCQVEESSIEKAE